MRTTYIGCIGTHAHCRQVTALLCLSDVMRNCILAYSGTSGSLFFFKKNGEQEKESFIHLRVG